MNRTLVRGFGTTTALGLGLVALAAVPAAAQEEVKDCQASIEEVEAHLDGRQNTNAPNLSHLLEAARQYAARGMEEECLEVMSDAAEFLNRRADVPEVRSGGSSVVPDQQPPLGDDEGEGETGVREDPGAPDADEPGFSDPEAVEEAGLEDVAEELDESGGGDDSGVLEDPDRAWREGVSPVAPPAPGVGEATTDPEPSATLADNPLAEVPVQEMIGMPLTDGWGDEVGTIEDVVAAKGDPEDVYAVVSPAGGLGEGGGDGAPVVVSLDRLRVAHERAIQWRVQQDEAPDLDEMPAYDAGSFQPLPRERLIGEVFDTPE